jgi:hypothetical protein
MSEEKNIEESRKSADGGLPAGQAGPEVIHVDGHTNIESSISNAELEIERSEIPMNSGTTNLLAGQAGYKPETENMETHAHELH